MTTQTGAQTLMVIGGWGVDARMLQAVVAGWPGPVHFVSLDDRRLACHGRVSELAEALIRHYPEPAVWLGWSQGAQVVMAAANAPGTPVEKVITLAGFPRFEAGDGWSAGMAPATFAAFRRALASDPDRAWRRFQQLLIHGGPKRDAGQARQELGQWLAAGPVATGEWLALGLEWLAREDQRVQWSRLDVPALHLLAGADALVAPWADGLPLPKSSRVRVLADMSHWPTGAKAAECRLALERFALAGAWV